MYFERLGASSNYLIRGQDKWQEYTENESVQYSQHYVESLGNRKLMTSILGGAIKIKRVQCVVLRLLIIQSGTKRVTKLSIVQTVVGQSKRTDCLLSSKQEVSSKRLLIIVL